MDFLRTCRSRLTDDGLLFLELPNAHDALITAYQCKRYRDIWYSKVHLTYWEPQTLVYALESAGFQPHVHSVQNVGLWEILIWLYLDGNAKAVKVGFQYEQPIWRKLDMMYREGIAALGVADQMRAVAYAV